MMPIPSTKPILELFITGVIAGYNWGKRRVPKLFKPAHCRPLKSTGSTAIAHQLPQIPISSKIVGYRKEGAFFAFKAKKALFF